MKICEHEGCTEEATVDCFLLDNDGSGPDERLCWMHAREAGYCPGCGNFWAGAESFDFSPSGYCENCAAEFDDDEYEEDLDFGFESGL